MGFRGQITYLSQLIADSITGAIINGGTITGALFRTAASGKRWEISSAQYNRIKGYSGNAGELIYGQLAVDIDTTHARTMVYLAPPSFFNADGGPNPDATSDPSLWLMQNYSGAGSGEIHAYSDKHVLQVLTTADAAGGGGPDRGTLQLDANGLNLTGAGTTRALTTVPTFDMIYPVGSIYMSVVSTNPGSLFGGTWAAWGTGRVPVAVDTTQTEFNTVEKTGGEKTHQLTAAESGVPVEGGGVVYQQNSGGTYFNIGSDGDPTHRANLLSGGANASQAHNNLQPYITCYMWKRTA